MYLKNFLKSLSTGKWPVLTYAELQKMEQKKRIERIWPKQKY